MPSDRDKILDYLESQIPALGAAATRIAYWQALAAGLSVLVIEDGAIVEVFPDGSRKFIKSISPPTEVAVATKLGMR